MAEFFPPVIFEIKAKATEAIASFGEVNKELLKMEKNGVIASNALGKMQTASKYAGTALLGLGGIFGAFAISSIKQLDTVETAQTRLSVAIKDTGVSFDVAKPYIDRADATMRNLGFSTADTYNALGTLTAASRNPKTALDTLSAAADLARYKQISLADASTLLARATIGQAKGLGDLGIAIGKTLPKGASLEQILKAVEDRTHGSAKAFSETLAGGLQKAQANFQNLEVNVGTKLVPALNNIINWINNTGIPGLNSFFGVISDNKGVVAGLVTALAGIWAAPKIIGIIAAIRSIIAEISLLRTAAALGAEAEAVLGFTAAPGSMLKLLLGGTAGVATAAAAVAATVGFGIYSAEQESARIDAMPVRPTIGGKAGAAAMASYQQQLAAWKKRHAAVITDPDRDKYSGTGSIDSGLKPTIIASGGSSKTKKTSIKKTEKLAVGGSGGVLLNVYVDGTKQTTKTGTQNNTLGKP